MMAARRGAGREARPGSREAWQRELPRMSDDVVLVRELHDSDAAGLLRHLSTPEVVRFMPAPPATLDGFRRFIRWTRDQRRGGRYFTFGIVPRGRRQAVGVVQIWPVELDFSTAEWGFALGEAFWGSGVFPAAARLVLEGAFNDLGVRRLEARLVETNERGSRTIEKLGATVEGTLRAGFRSHGRVENHVMWSILAEEWRAQALPAGPAQS